MSNLVFPSISPGTGWSWHWPIKKTHKFTTLVQTPASQRGELRIPLQTFPIWLFGYDISYMKGSASVSSSFFAQILGFYGLVQGAADDWLFQDIYDYIVGSFQATGSVTSGQFVTTPDGRPEQVVQASTGASAPLLTLVTGSNPMIIGPFIGGVADASHHWVGQTSGAVYTPSGAPTVATAQEIGVGDATTTQFLMYRQIGGTMIDIVQNFISPPSIYLNGVLKTVTTDYTIDQYGNLTFTTAPGSGVAITWTGQFYFRARFLEDQIDSLQQRWLNVWAAAELLKFKSIIL